MGPFKTSHFVSFLKEKFKISDSRKMHVWFVDSSKIGGVASTSYVLRVRFAAKTPHFDRLVWFPSGQARLEHCVRFMNETGHEP